MAYFFLGIFAVVALLFVAQPLLSSKRYLLYLEDMFDFGGERKLDYLDAKKQVIQDNISDLEFEYQMGKLSEEDFDRLRKDCNRETEEVDKAIDALKIKREIEELIESEIDSRRKIK
ncbi:MAG: hypothetical protein GTO51_02065 [Candidatus Latescibacteria bacterium]|nr:hypothetical protein [Candidatus Latescibacterota bacterium]NIM22399.1 hypothetical protein [Candidatus Latescibacterota bacterium]NIM64759.1 hypothetical protein [Candidatus Latescibacterota bacterium]NIO01270.1 hypothetical protein [Candidatus Latescibacterota bacterium]NIO27762.1 hypothetical protein [Candidatus Latescibacterota bacterium]